jgi:hypothetical protein
MLKETHIDCIQKGILAVWPNNTRVDQPSKTEERSIGMNEGMPPKRTCFCLNSLSCSQSASWLELVAVACLRATASAMRALSMLACCAAAAAAAIVAWAGDMTGRWMIYQMQDL